ncbi:ADP-ribosylation-containing protein [Dioscorea alata]|uniref:ADP-ribosylation-containing protein n=2 Tax=Dioscorea alata TaxID=55571 RepID=A0ACB7TY57_DIOAL|nr:ADP-ribosylation-containing protein [Dioscorea alata]KAH7652990.1 ADP-ribosylation-containing protein [Dioscorea alata]
MPTVWFSLKKSLHCRSEPCEVYDPKLKRSGRSGCSRSIANLKDVIHGSKRHLERPASYSPRSIGSSEFLNPIAHEVILSDSKCELKITGFGACHESIGTLRPGTPGPWGQLPSDRVVRCATVPKRSAAPFGDRDGTHSVSLATPKAATFAEGSDVSCVPVSCPKCGESFAKLEALESHHLSKHAVTELVEGDSSRKIVEIICRASWLKTESNCGRIERVLKVHNTQKTLAWFEEYRETVKIKAAKLPKKHPRCLADGNELLRFHGTTISCSLGMNGSSSLCTLGKCSICQIIRNGFSMQEETKEHIGVFTTATSGRAFESINLPEDDPFTRKALLVCRVIAGRVHRPLDNYQELAGQSGFDSLAGKVGLYANIEELYLLNPRALLPCFVVICKL